MILAYDYCVPGGPSVNSVSNCSCALNEFLRGDFDASHGSSSLVSSSISGHLLSPEFDSHLSGAAIEYLIHHPLGLGDDAE